MVTDLLTERRASGGGDREASGEPALERVAAELAAVLCREQRVLGLAAALGEPCAQRRDAAGGERRDPLLAALSAAADVGACAEVGVAAAQPGQLGGAQPRLDGDEHQGVVAASGPARSVAWLQQRVDFGLGEERDQPAFEPFRWDREHPLDRAGVLGVAQRRERKQRVDRREARVAGPRAVAAFALEVVEERADQLGVEVVERQPRRRPADALLAEGEQQPQRVAVGGDGVRAGVALSDQPLGEERLQRRCEQRHVAPRGGARGARRRARAARARPTSTNRCPLGGRGRGRSRAAAGAPGRRPRPGTNRAWSGPRSCGVGRGCADVGTTTNMPTSSLCRPGEKSCSAGVRGMGVGIIRALRGRRGACRGASSGRAWRRAVLVRSIASCLWVMSACR